MSKISSNDERDRRVRALEALIGGNLPISELKSLLEKFEFDSEPLVILRGYHIVDQIKRYLSGEIPAGNLEDWADLIEVRDDILFDPINSAEIKQAIHDLANPILVGPLEHSTAYQIISLLSGRK